jgi:hypothetical protein
MSGKSQLSATQRREIVRLRLSGRTYKEICRAVDCTVRQANHVCRLANVPKTRKPPDQRMSALAIAWIKSKTRTLEREQAQAKQELAKQIALAKQEAPGAPIFRSGDTGSRRPGK